MSIRLFLFLLTCSFSGYQLSAQHNPTVEADSVNLQLSEEARRLASLSTNKLSEDFLRQVSRLPAMVYMPEIYYNKAEKRAINAEDYDDKKDDGFERLNLSAQYYYYTRYGSPLAFMLPLEILGHHLHDRNDLNLIDYGFGTIGHLKLLTMAGHRVRGIDVDPIMEVLYKKEVERIPGLDMSIGVFPRDSSMKLPEGSLDVFVSKNTLKKGYVAPDIEVDARFMIDLGGTREQYLARVHQLLKRGGHFLIYNLHGQRSEDAATYKPWTDGRSPFTRAQLQQAGFEVLAFDKDDTDKARQVAVALGWAAQMNLEKDLFATYTLLKKR